MTDQKHTVSADEAGERLDRLCVKLLDGLSRTKIKKHIKQGEIRINGKETTVHHFIREGDIVDIRIDDTKDMGIVIPEPNIIDETDDYLIINKPYDILVHPIESNTSAPSLIPWLKQRYPDIGDVGEDPLRPGIVHRLDRDATGVLVIAKTQEAFEHLKRQFKERLVGKQYLALVYGNFSDIEGVVRFSIGRGKDGRMAARPAESEDGRYAETAFHVEKRFRNFDLVQLIPKTGRTHQLRVHMNARGHPIVGDRVYKPNNPKERINAKRIILHATQLSFVDRERKQQLYTSPFPDELQGILKKLEPVE